MRLDDLDYELPAGLIAQTPVEPRDSARLLVYERATGERRLRVFSELLDDLREDDVVVVNQTRVLPARLRLRRPTGGAAELLLLEPRPDGAWEALARPARKLRPGTALAGAGGLVATIVEQLGEGRVTVRIDAPGTLEQALGRAGEMPLPPYIRTPLADPERYQTVYSASADSAAAPTAGLHFTPELWARLGERHELLKVDLHVGIDTFRPVEAPDLDDHLMHSEAYAVEPEVRARLAACRAEGRRIVAVGTTTVRVLETIADPAAPDVGRTRLKIQPGYDFRLVDALITNFHLPRSTLLALVMAFAGVEETRALYALAIRERLRFYSFGDAMLIL